MYLATVAKTAADSAKDGNTAVEIPSQPATGNHCNLTENRQAGYGTTNET